ncbi:Asd/ArgC dimerization domain-containing protein [Aeromonas jandaei]|uniref:Asd/ArgC dimerization domain-containing protein n=1 Tax=Aeromonas jandaei TaxID=650 RepID=UPI00214C375C
MPGAISVNGLCIRVGVLRCHSAAITMKLRREVHEQEFSSLIQATEPCRTDTCHYQRLT